MRPVYELFIIRWYHIFFNPFFFIRRELFKNIRQAGAGVKGKLLDFGCGIKPYRSCFPGVGEYIGLDFDGGGSPYQKQMVDVFYDGHTIPFGDGHFDALLATEVLEHIFNPDEIVAEWSRVLKKGGSAIITCPFAWPEHEQPWDYARYSSFGVAALLEKHGFRVIECRKTGNWYITIIQLWVMYLYYLIPKWPVVSQLLFLVLCFPFLLLGLIGYILPVKVGRKELYLNNVIIAVKDK